MSLDEQEYDEKRDFIRMFINAPVDFAISGSNDWNTGTGKDLSGGGLSFSSDKPMSEGEKVDIKLHPLTPVTPPLEASVTVIRTDELEDNSYIVSTRIDKIQD